MRQTPLRVWHNIRPNEQTRMPRRHIFIDTESRHARRGRTGRQTWRLAVACYATGRKGSAPRHEWKEYKDPKALLQDVSRFCGESGRVVLWAHNLGHDTRIMDVFNILPALGWELLAHSITPRSTWLEWKRGKATLLMVDSVAVFNTTIEQVGNWHGIGKTRIELDSDDERDWFARCRADVRILQTAVEAYLDWLERADMGNWQLTGAGQSWAAYRHRFLTHKLVVHDEPDVLAAERTALWTGRCEAYWRGTIKGERVYEFDFKGAYPRIARDYHVPIRYVGPLASDALDGALEVRGQSATLLHIQVDTDVPVLPTRHDGRILWPTGTFTTTVWDIEAIEARRAGARISVLGGYSYRKAPALKAWGEWILAELARPDSEIPAWRKAILKHWSRALIGRFAMTYNQWDELGEMPDSTAKRGILYDSRTKTRTEFMQVGRTVWQDIGRTEWQHSMPMITGYIQAIGRVHLWQILSQLPDRTAIYVDTDSILCTDTGVEAIQNAARSFAHGELRLKRAWDGFSIFGPRQIVTGEQVRVSGIPRIARRTPDGTFEGEIWDSLLGAFRTGTLDTVVTRDRTWKVEGVDFRRASSGFGWTRPIEIHQ